MSFEFDETKHEYRMDGRSVPSVTQILSVVQDFSSIPPEQLRIAAEWGSAVHEYLQLYDAGELDLKKADPRMLPIIDAWERMKIARGWVNPLISEEKYYSEKYRFAGKLDRLFKSGDVYTLIDFKTGDHQYTDLQTSAYLHLVRENYAMIRADRMMIHFDIDGKVRSETYPMSDFKKDFSDFLCIMRTFQIKNKK